MAPNVESNTLNLYSENALNRRQSTGKTGQIDLFVLHSSPLPCVTQMITKNDIVTWMLEVTKGRQKSVRDFVNAVLLTNFAAIHTTTMVEKCSFTSVGNCSRSKSLLPTPSMNWQRAQNT